MLLRHPPFRPNGQTALELILAVGGVVTLLYVIVQSWGWMTNMLVQRQQSFETSRVAAGQPASAGTIVPYAREPLRLLPSASQSLQSLRGAIALWTPSEKIPCSDAAPYYANARSLAAQARQIEREQIQPREQQIAALKLELCRSIDTTRTAPFTLQTQGFVDRQDSAGADVFVDGLSRSLPSSLGACAVQSSQDDTPVNGTWLSVTKAKCEKAEQCNSRKCRKKWGPRCAAASQGVQERSNRITTLEEEIEQQSRVAQARMAQAEQAERDGDRICLPGGS